MTQPDLLAWTPPEGHRDGKTYSHTIDYDRLNAQAADVAKVMADQCWHTLDTIEIRTGHPQASISARLRDLRKPRFGGHKVERQRMKGGIYMYRLVL
jgi:hypothetical protein